MSESWLRPGWDTDTTGGISASGSTAMESFNHLLTMLDLTTGEGDIIKGNFFENLGIDIGDISEEEEEELSGLVVSYLSDIWTDAGQPYIKSLEFPENWQEDPFYISEAEEFMESKGTDSYKWTNFRPHFSLGDYGQTVPDTLYLEGTQTDYWDKQRYDELMANKPDGISNWEYSELISEEFDLDVGPERTNPELLDEFFAEMSHAFQYNKEDEGFLSRFFGRKRLAKQGQRERREHGEDVYDMEGFHEWHAHNDPDYEFGEIQLNYRFQELINNYLMNLEE